jgi:hypothetical protein
MDPNYVEKVLAVLDDIVEKRIVETEVVGEENEKWTFETDLLKNEPKVKVIEKPDGVFLYKTKECLPSEDYYYILKCAYCRSHMRRMGGFVFDLEERRPIFMSQFENYTHDGIKEMVCDYNAGFHMLKKFHEKLKPEDYELEEIFQDTFPSVHGSGDDEYFHPTIYPNKMAMVTSTFLPPNCVEKMKKLMEENFLFKVEDLFEKTQLFTTFSSYETPLKFLLRFHQTGLSEKFRSLTPIGQRLFCEAINTIAEEEKQLLKKLLRSSEELYDVIKSKPTIEGAIVELNDRRHHLNFHTSKKERALRAQAQKMLFSAVLTWKGKSDLDLVGELKDSVLGRNWDSQYVYFNNRTATYKDETQITLDQDSNVAGTLTNDSDDVKETIFCVGGKTVVFYVALYRRACKDSNLPIPFVLTVHNAGQPQTFKGCFAPDFKSYLNLKTDEKYEFFKSPALKEMCTITFDKPESQRPVEKKQGEKTFYSEIENVGIFTKGYDMSTQDTDTTPRELHIRDSEELKNLIYLARSNSLFIRKDAISPGYVTRLKGKFSNLLDLDVEEKMRHGYVQMLNQKTYGVCLYPSQKPKKHMLFDENWQTSQIPTDDTWTAHLLLERGDLLRIRDIVHLQELDCYFLVVDGAKVDENANLIGGFSYDLLQRIMLERETTLDLRNAWIDANIEGAPNQVDLTDETFVPMIGGFVKCHDSDFFMKFLVSSNFDCNKKICLF